MFGFRRRRQVREEAAQLIAEHGAEEAWSIAYDRSRDRGCSPEEHKRGLRVRREIERRLGMPPRVDTATRYREG